MTEFECPEVTLCGWQDVKVQLPTNSVSLTHANTHTYMHACTHTHTHTHACAHAGTHACMHKHTHTHTHTTHSYQCVQYFSVSDQWCGYQRLGFSMCTHTLILAAVHRDAGCVNTVRESAFRLTLKQIVDLSPCFVHLSHFSSSPYSKTVLVSRNSAHSPNSHRIGWMICSVFNTGWGFLFFLFFFFELLFWRGYLLLLLSMAFACTAYFTACAFCAGFC